MAWVVLAASAAALCAVVAAASARAPSTTPFFASGAAVVAGAGAGAVLQLGKKSLRLHPIAHAAIAIGVAFIAALPAGFIKYTYGSDGSVVISLAAAPLDVTYGEGIVVVGAVSLYNDGAATVRVRPVIEVLLSDHLGVPRPQILDGCPLTPPPQPAEHDLVEIAPAVTYAYEFTIHLAWVSGSGTSGACGAFIIAQRGVYLIRATFESHPFSAFAPVPVWSGNLTSEAARLDVH